MYIYRLYQDYSDNVLLCIEKIKQTHFIPKRLDKKFFYFQVKAHQIKKIESF